MWCIILGPQSLGFDERTKNNAFIAESEPPFHQLWQRRDLLHVDSLSLAATAVQVGS